jgi:DnaK suppressor protein
MNQIERDNLKTEINKQIEQLITVIVSLKENAVPIEPSVSLGRLTRMDAIQQSQMAEANLQTSENRLGRLQGALLKIDKPNFGFCINCNQDIPYERLLVLPETNFCVQCSSKKK